MGGQGSPVSWRWFQTFGRWRQEGRWTQGEVREETREGTVPVTRAKELQSALVLTLMPCCVCPCFHAPVP